MKPQSKPILPGATLGLLGGGQLGRMFIQSARQMGYEVIVMDPDPNSPAAGLATDVIQAGYEDPDALDVLAERCDVITTEFENVPAASLEQLQLSVPVYPSPASLAVAQNRVREKTFVRDLGLPVTPFQAWDVRDALNYSGAFPVLLKTASMGYDGKGQCSCETHEELIRAGEELGGALIIEQKIDLAMECSVILARSTLAEVQCFPVAQNIHRNGVLEFTVAPAEIEEKLQNSLLGYATQLAEALDYVGVLAVEFFIDQSNQVYFNEMAPRPHNSGHFTLDACVTSQFEQQLRAVCGLPLGSSNQHSPALMWNILGDEWLKADGPALRKWMEIPQAHLHLYGKSEARRGRKMGHITRLNASLDRFRDELQT